MWAGRARLGPLLVGALLVVGAFPGSSSAALAQRALPPIDQPVPVPAPAGAAQQSWLDAPLTNWNPAGRPLPTAPRPDSGSRDPQCASREREPATAEDQQVVAAGWGLYSTYQAGWDVTIVSGTSDYDGMCRPMGYQVFVFLRGQYAGTIAPVPMASRADGALSDVHYFGGDQLTGTFVRYAPDDPLCCPSRPSVFVTYRLVTTPNGPSLQPVDRT